MTPTDTADTELISGRPLTASRASSQRIASASATYAPVIAAVRVPPSACSTSQSIEIVFSPSPDRSIAARSDRPISREISWVRPPIRPLTDSRSLRVSVARGSIAYSAVTQPRPLPRRHRGTDCSTDAEHSTFVSPNSTSAEPSAYFCQSRVIVDRTKLVGSTSVGARHTENLTDRRSGGWVPAGDGRWQRRVRRVPACPGTVAGKNRATTTAVRILATLLRADPDTVRVGGLVDREAVPGR